MTTPTTPITLPPRLVEAALANPLPGGLYAAATLVPLDDPAHLDGGVQVEQRNCGEATIWQLGCDPDANPDDKGAGDTDEPNLETFDAIGVLATSRCGLVGRTEERAREDASQKLRLQEQLQAETWASTALLTASGTPATAEGGLVGAVGRIEQALGVLGVQGVIHAPASLAAVAMNARLAVPSASGKFLSPLGHLWAFGAGYGALVNRIVGTGPVTVYRTPVAVSVGLGQRQNERLAVAEREVAVTWECGAWAALIEE